MKKEAGKVIRAIRKRLGHKQDYVASKLNITPGSLANLENGRTGMDIEKIYHLSRIYNVTASCILELTIEIYESDREESLDGAIRYITSSQKEGGKE